MTQHNELFEELNAKRDAVAKNSNNYELEISLRRYSKDERDEAEIVSASLVEVH